MRSLSLTLLLLCNLGFLFAQNPHGEKLKLSCSDCHNSESWKLILGSYPFDHITTGFILDGQHANTDCRSCHSSLVFEEADPSCISCHTDMHQQTTSLECGNCHNTSSWIVNNINQIHQMSRFPLLGAHFTADCIDCHTSASSLNFEPLGVECIDCHESDYMQAKEPDHVAGGYSLNCIECHQLNAFGWTGTNINHDFFPLTKGHDIISCNDCHTPGTFDGLSQDCISCHTDDYQNANNPSHVSLNFPENCTECHTTDPGWKPADYRDHDLFSFPIYSGEHRGEWNDCADCHQTASDYAQFTCISCHEHNRADMDDEHNDVGGYLYESYACLECHPLGNADDNSFNHNTSDFPLLGAHLNTACKECHAAGYQGTPVECEACHIESYNQSTNPSHTALGLSTACAECHTEQAGWQPATFLIHNDYYLLNGVHATVADQCVLCHEGNYNDSPNSCVECHQESYFATVNPNHELLALSTSCEECHTTQANWEPALFPVHNDFYVLNGAHAAIANDCVLCHNSDYNNTANSCYACHTADYNQATDPPHQSAQFPIDCESCHTEMSWEPSTFNHDALYFPIYSGKHNGEWNSCIECHTNPSNYAVFSCIDCHEHNQPDMDSEHQGVPDYVYESSACLSCHPDGEDSKFMRFQIQKKTIR